MENNLGTAIKIAREAKNITQEQLAEAFGITRGAVSQWEKFGKIDSKHYPKLEEMLGITIETKILTKDQQDLIESTNSKEVGPKIEMLQVVPYSKLDLWYSTGGTTQGSEGLQMIEQSYLSGILWGPHKFPVVLIHTGTAPAGTKISQLSRLLCTDLDSLNWDNVNGVYVVLYQNGLVRCQWFIGSNDDKFIVKLDDQRTTELDKSQVKALYTVHHIVGPVNYI